MHSAVFAFNEDIDINLMPCTDSMPRDNNIETEVHYSRWPTRALQQTFLINLKYLITQTRLIRVQQTENKQI